LPSNLCLDAPLVAAGWAALVSFDLNGGYPPLHKIGGLFFAVWGIYLFDRLYDSFRRPLIEVTPRRHVFAKRQRLVLFVLSGIAAVTAGIFVLPHVDERLIKAAVFPGLVCFLYFVFFRFIERGGGILFPAKELVIGFCFASGILVAADIRFSSPFGMVMGGALAALFTSNCLIIGRAEREFDRQFDAASFFGKCDRGNRIPMVLLIGSIFLAAVLWLQGLVLVLGGIVFVCCLLQFACWKWAGKELMQPLADGALLFPWVVVLFFG
jgi:4-hydroxybenzoate polyprenyltransferase